MIYTCDYLITNNQFDIFKKNFDSLVELYKEKYAIDKKRDWQKYERDYTERLEVAAREMRPIVAEANHLLLHNLKHIGRMSAIGYTDKTMILLLKDIFEVSNRKMACFLKFFSTFTGIETSYKTVERLYSDPIIMMTVHNVLKVTVKRKDIKHANISGDGTGYSLTVLKHYSTNVKKQENGQRTFVWAFAFIDLDTNMYVGYGSGMRSEKEAFNNAKQMMDNLGIKIDTTRLDMYYTYQSITEEFDKDTKLYILPKSNTAINGNSKWHETWKSLMRDTMRYLQEYYRRESSESGFAADKKSNGWKVWQKRDDRISTSIMCKGAWHNLLWIGES